MYCDFFGLRCNPFEGRTGAQFFYATPERKKILAAVENTSHCGEGIALILGEAGVGKTLLIRALLLQSHSTNHVVILTRPADGEMDLIRETCKRFGATLPSSYNSPRGLAALRRHLRHTAKVGHRSILVIDRAENLTVGNLSELATLMDLQHKGDKVLTVILVGQPRFRVLLEKPESAGIRRRLPDAWTLPALSLDETVAYIEYRLRIAGAGETDLFDREAVAMIQQASKGIPRLINQMCDTAMMVAYGAGETRVGRDIAAEVTEGSSTSVERSVGAREIGVGSAREVARGLPPSLTTEAVVEPQRSLSDSCHAAAPADQHGAKTGSGNTSHGPGVAGREAYESTLPDSRAGEALVRRMEELFSGGEALLERLERTLARADRMSDTSEAVLLQSTAVEKHLASLTGNAGAVVSGLSGSIQNATESLSGIEERTQDLLNEAEHRAKLVETRMSRVPETTNEAREQSDRLEQACERADAVEANLTSFAEQLVDKADTVQQRITVLMSALQASEGMQQKAQETLDQVSTVTSNADTAQQEVETMRENVSSVTADAGVRFDADITDYRAKLEEMLAEAGMQVERVEAATMASREKAEEAIAACQRSQVTLIEKADHDASRLGERLDALESRRTDVQLSVAALGERVKDTVSSVGELDRTAERIKPTIEDLHSRANAAKTSIADSVERGEKLMLDAKEACGQIEALQHSIAASLSELGSAYERANTLHGQMTQCEQVAARLDYTRDQGEKVADKLDAAVSSVSPMREEIQHLMANVEGKVAQLDSHNAAAKNVLHELSEANVVGHNVVEKANESTRNAEQAVMTAAEEVDRLLQDVWGLTAKAEVTAEKLAGSNTKAESLIENVEASTQPAREVAEQLAQHIESGGELADRMAEQCGRASKLVESLASITPLLRDAKNVEGSVKTTFSDVRAVYDDLTASARNAEQQGARLQQLNVAADDLIEKHTQLKQESQQLTEQVAKQLAEQTESTQSSAEAGKHLLAEFAEQANGLAGKLHELRVKAAETEETVTRATAKPVQLVATARAQAAQLEQVCAAVRRVFASLSKVSLEAKQQTDECNRASGEATERLVKLTADTERVSSTLHEWIEEAVRAQARLERTLQQAPSIRETHPSDALVTISRTLRPANRIANPSVSGELQMLTEPEPNAASHKEPVVKPKARAEEVSQLIENAKHAAAVKA